MKAAFDALSSEIAVLKKAAGILRRDIQAAFAASTDSPWPPSVDFLQTVSPPQSVLNFVSNIVDGKDACKATERGSRVSKSISEDLCYAATCGKWQMPKHLLLGMSLRHLTGSADIVTILNRYGHCVSYTKVLELEIAERQCAAIKHYTDR